MEFTTKHQISVQLVYLELKNDIEKDQSLSLVFLRDGVDFDKI